MSGGEGRAHVGELDAVANLRPFDAITMCGRGRDRRPVCLAGEGLSSRDSRLGSFSRPMKPGFHVPPRLERALRPAEGLTTQDALQKLARSRRTIRIGVATGRASRLRPIDTRGMDAADIAACRAAYEFRAFGRARAPSLGCGGLNGESPCSSPLQRLKRVGARLDRCGIVELQTKGVVLFSGRLGSILKLATSCRLERFAN